ncbi:hypothetical protein AOLI_G00190940 [Acnodon oligacanthus]
MLRDPARHNGSALRLFFCEYWSQERNLFPGEKDTCSPRLLPADEQGAHPDTRSARTPYLPRRPNQITHSSRHTLPPLPPTTPRADSTSRSGLRERNCIN